MSLAFVHALDSPEPHTDAIWGLAWTSTDTVVSASADGSVKQWDSTAAGKNLHSFPPHTLGLGSLSVSPDGQRALSNSIEGLTCLWDLVSGQLVGKYESFVRTADNTHPSWCVSIHPNGATYASTGSSGNVIIRSAEPEMFGERRSVLQSGRSKFGLFCKHSPDGSKLALSTEAGQIYIFDLESATLTSNYAYHSMSVRSLAWSPDSQLLLSASDDKRLGLHDVRTGKASAVAALTGHSSWVLCADFSPDGRLALSGSADKSIKVWDLSARAAVSTIPETGAVWGVSWRPKMAGGGGSLPGAFVSGGDDGVVKWWRSAGSASSS